MKRPRARSRRDPTISLINIVFLILIFFMVSSTLSRPLGGDLQLVTTDGLECCAGTEVLEVGADGALLVGGQLVSGPDVYLDGLPDSAPARIVPDRRLPARDLLRLVGELRARGADQILIITENTP
jgi:biopolymer transport protein ExbD